MYNLNLCQKIGNSLFLLSKHSRLSTSVQHANMWFLNVCMGSIKEVRRVVTAHCQMNLPLMLKWLAETIPWENNKSSRAGKTVLLWSKLWLWAKVSTLKVIMFVGRWECGRGVFWDFHSALGWIVSWWIWWKTGGGDVEGGRLSVAVAKMMHLSFSLTSKLGPVTSLFMNTTKILIVLPYFLMTWVFTALCVAWWVC